MKYLKIAAGSLLLALLPVLAWVGLARAQTFRSTVDDGQVVNSSLYSAGKTVDIRGTINGDVYCAGRDVIVDATVHGDVLCAGQNVNISGKVDGSVRVAGQIVAITAHVGRSASIAAQTLTLTNGSRIGQDATIAGNTAELNGAIGRDVVLAGADATISDAIGRNVRATGNALTLTGNAHVRGSLTFTSNNEADISSQAHIDGTVRHITPTPTKRRVHPGTFFAFSALFFVAVLVCLVAFSLVLVLAFPQYINAVSQVAAKRLGMAILAGFVASFAVPIGIVLLAVSLVGLPLAIFGLLVWLAVLMLSGPIAAYYLGSMVWAKAKNPIWIMLLGSVLLVVLYFIPLVGGLVMLVAMWLGSGALLLAAKGRVRPPRYKVS